VAGWAKGTVTVASLLELELLLESVVDELLDIRCRVAGPCASPHMVSPTASLNLSSCNIRDSMSVKVKVVYTVGFTRLVATAQQWQGVTFTYVVIAG
jgi:hypothetical protein